MTVVRYSKTLNKVESEAFTHGGAVVGIDVVLLVAILALWLIIIVHFLRTVHYLTGTTPAPPFVAQPEVSVGQPSTATTLPFVVSWPLSLPLAIT